MLIKDLETIDEPDNRMVNKPIPDDEERVELNIIEEYIDEKGEIAKKEVSLSIPKKTYDEIKESDSNFRKREEIFWKQIKLNSLKAKIKEKNKEMNHYLLFSKVDSYTQEMINGKIFTNNLATKSIPDIKEKISLIKNILNKINSFIKFFKELKLKKDELEKFRSIKFEEKIEEENVFEKIEKENVFKKINLKEDFKNTEEINLKFKSSFSPQEFSSMGEILKELDKTIKKANNELREIDGQISQKREEYSDYEMDSDFWMKKLEIVVEELLREY